MRFNKMFKYCYFQTKPTFRNVVAKYILKSLIGKALRLLTKRSAAARREVQKIECAIVKQEVLKHAIAQNDQAFSSDQLDLFSWNSQHEQLKQGMPWLYKILVASCTSKGEEANVMYVEFHIYLTNGNVNIHSGIK